MMREESKKFYNTNNDDGLAKSSIRRLHSREIQKVITFPPSVAMLLGVSQMAQTSSSLTGSCIAFAIYDTDNLSSHLKKYVITTETQPILKQAVSCINNIENTFCRKVIPANAGIQNSWLDRLDSRIRGNEEQKD